MFLFSKIKDLKSQKIVIIGLTFFGLPSFFQFLLHFQICGLHHLHFPLICFIFSHKNLKKEIIAKLNKEGLSDKEIYLLQKLAGIKKINILNL